MQLIKHHISDLPTTVAGTAAALHPSLQLLWGEAEREVSFGEREARQLGPRHPGAHFPSLPRENDN